MLDKNSIPRLITIDGSRVTQLNSQSLIGVFQNIILLGTIPNTTTLGCWSIQNNRTYIFVQFTDDKQFSKV